MTVAVLAGPGVLAGVCLFLYVTPWLERLTGIPQTPSTTALPASATHLEGAAVVGHITVPETNPSWTSV